MSRVGGAYLRPQSTQRNETAVARPCQLVVSHLNMNLVCHTRKQKQLELGELGSLEIINVTLQDSVEGSVIFLKKYAKLSISKLENEFCKIIVGLYESKQEIRTPRIFSLCHQSA